ncbi:MULTISPECIES: sulfur carrier protein ThiS [unclassified Nocardioides]|uniref:sulfur carrier protein ThiS n=1 Tax=unclassified Nocardioides TaxID=2615069 RepID=UPI00361C6DE7
MRITVNGAAREVPSPCTLDQLVTRTDGVAAAINGEVVCGGDWAGTLLSDGDAVEVLTALQGG